MTCRSAAPMLLRHALALALALSPLVPARAQTQAAESQSSGSQTTETPPESTPPAPGPAPASRPNPLSRLPIIGRFFGDPTITDGSDGGKVSPRYALDIQAPDRIARQIREFTLLGRWRQRADYDESQMPLFIDRAPGEIRELLAAEGYFSPEVTVSAIEGGARVVVLPGPRVQVGSVSIRMDGELLGPEHDALRARIERGWLMPAAEPFRAEDWEGAKRALLDSVRDRGYLRAKLVRSEAQVDLDTGLAALMLDIDSGQPLRFGELQIEGLQRYPASVVAGLSTFKPGDPYDVRRIVELQTRLNGAGWFTTASVRPNVRALDQSPELQDVPIRIDVIERQSKRWVVGGGYDADNGLNVLAGWENRNVAGVGIQTFNGVEFDVRRQLAFSTWDFPQDVAGYRWQAGARFEHRDIQNDLVDAASLFVARLHRRGPVETGLSLQYQAEQQSIVFAQDDERFYRNRALVLGWSWTVRDLDSPIMPTRGTITTVQLSGASKSLGSAQSFVRAYALGYKLIPLSHADGVEFGRVVLRGELGAVHADAREGIPSANLFRTGGSKSVRGYSSQSLGLNLGDAVVGGRYLATASAEYQHLFGRDWALAGFVDAGNAADSIGALKPVVGVGVGLRWRTPVGPLHVDLARGLDLNQWRLYFSIGVIF